MRFKLGCAALLLAFILPDAAAARTLELKLRAAVKAKHVAVVDARGAGLNLVKLTLKARVDIKVTIPSGTFFDTKPGATHQRMVVTHQKRVRLDEGETETVEVRTACANFHRAIPRGDDHFFLGQAPQGLRSLVRCLETRKITAVQRQIAVWIVTDKIDRQTLVKRPAMTRPLMGRICDEGRRRRLMSKERCRRMVKRTSAKLLEEALKRGPELVKACRTAAGKAKDALKKGVRKGYHRLK